MAKIDTANIKKVKGALEDLLVGIGKESQERVTGTKQVTKINVSDLNGVLALDTFNELRAIDINLLGPSKLVVIAGSSIATDKLGGIFVWDDNSIAPDDDKSVIKTISNTKGRFIRIDNKYINTMEVNDLFSDSIDNSGNIATDTLDAGDITATRNISTPNANITELRVTSRALTTGIFSHAGNFNVSGEITCKNIEADNFVANNIDVTSFTNDVTFDGNITANKYITANNITSNNGSFVSASINNLTNDITFDGNITARKAINADNIVTNNVTTNIITSSTASIDNFTKDTVFDKNVTIKGRLVISDIDGGGVVIPQALEIESLKTSGDVTIEGELHANKIKGITFTQDDETGNEIITFDNAGVNNDLVVNGKSTMNNNLVVNGSIATSGNISTNSRVTANSILSGDITSEGIVSVKSDLNVKANINLDVDLLPSDGISLCGSPSRRFKQICSINGTIQTSDDRTKTYLPIDDREYKAAKEMLRALRKFKRIDGDRIHFGVSAQTVRDILSDNGLNPLDYSFLCYDEWSELDEKTKQFIKVDRYSIRYEELYAFIMITLIDKGELTYECS